MPAGIETRHARSCRTRKGGRCDCTPTFRASVWDGRNKKRHRRTFASPAEAQGWHTDASRALRRGRTVAAAPTATLNEVAAAWLEGAASGAIRTRAGERFKAGTLRAYEASLRLRVLPALGHENVADIRRVDVQELADELLAQGCAPSTITLTVAALQTIYRREVSRERVRINPANGLDLPAPSGRRDRIASPAEGDALLAALHDRDRALWATALFAGLRRGELQALRVSDVDFEAGWIRVDRSWDRIEGAQSTKSRNRRKVPISRALTAHLKRHLLRTGRRGDDLMFGRTATDAFTPSSVTKHAKEAWEAAGLKRITLHECRHTFASYMIASGANAKAISNYMGHSSIVITYDRYGHLMPGNEGEAAELLDAYLERSLAVPSA